MPASLLAVDWKGTVPMLLKSDGSAYAGMTYVRNLVISHQRRFPEIIQMANNNEAFSNVGESKEYIDSFTVEAWTAAAAQGIKNDLANEANDGLFMLEVPSLTTTTTTRYLIRFWEAGFTRLYPRRAGFPDVLSADIENIRVFSSTVA